MRHLPLRSLFVAAGLSVCALSGCGPIPNTGFEISVLPPTRFTPGKDFNNLYVSVTTNTGAVESETIAITANTPTPYQVVVLMNGKTYLNATITAYLELNETQIAGQILPPKGVVQNQLTPETIDLTAQ
jgi:hypothetical protein